MSDIEKLKAQHRAEIQQLTKAMKKVKGAYKEAAKVKLAEAEERHERELAALSGEANADGDDGQANSSDPHANKRKIKRFDEEDWTAMSKKELEQACQERNVGKKGNREKLIMNLILFHQEQDKALGPDGDAVELDEKEAASAHKVPNKWLQGDDDDDDSDDGDDENDNDDADGDEDDGDDDEDASSENNGEGVLAERMAEEERYLKREKVVIAALKKALENRPNGFAMEDTAAELEAVGVKNFTPELLGYANLHAMYRLFPREVCGYDRNTKKIYPPRAATGGGGGGGRGRGRGKSKGKGGGRGKRGRGR